MRYAQTPNSRRLSHLEGRRSLVRGMAGSAALATLIALSALTFAGPAQAITGSTPSVNFAAVAMGVQVTPDWIVTARHVVLGPGALYSNGYGVRTVAASYALPGDFPNDDLALIRLVPSVAPNIVPFMSVSADRIAEGTFAPWAVTIASSANSTGPRGYAYTTIIEADDFTDPDGPGPLTDVRVNYLVSQDSTTYVEGGDSGGALFAGQVTDTGRLLGVTSALLTDDNDVPTGSAFVQLAAYRDWIDATMAADAADNQTLNWVSSVPEPGTLALYAAGLALLSQARRRKVSAAAPDA